MKRKIEITIETERVVFVRTEETISKPHHTGSHAEPTSEPPEAPKQIPRDRHSETGHENHEKQTD